MPRNSFRLVILLICLGLSFVVLASVYFKWISFNTKKTVSSVVSPSSPSPFGNLVYGNSVDMSQLRNDSGVKDIVNFIENVGKTSGSQGESTPWNYKSSYFTAYIVGVDRNNGIMRLWIYLPDNMTFSKVITEVKVNCTTYNTSLLYAKGMQILNPHVDIFKYSEAGSDGLMAYCLDESCSLIGRSCAILKGLYNLDENVNEDTK